MVAAGLIATLPLAAAELEDEPPANASLFHAVVRSATAIGDFTRADPAEDSELWLGDFPAASGQFFQAYSADTAELGDGGDEAAERPTVFHQIEDVLPQQQAPAHEAAETDVPAAAAPGPFAGGGEQLQAASAIQPDKPAPITEPVSDIVADALEGRVVDLDMLLGTEPPRPELSLLPQMTEPLVGGDAGSAMPSTIFTIDLSQQQAMAQLEHAAATGHA
jgi:hypothetical protein